MGSSSRRSSPMSSSPCERCPSANGERKTRMAIGGGGRFFILSAAIVISFASSIPTTTGYTLRDLLHLNQPATDAEDPFLRSQFKAPEEVYLAEKRAGSCPPWKPFQCPEGTCIPLKYLCDYNVDCAESGYDENKKMCTAALRPTVESTEEFLSHQLREYGDDYFVKLLGSKAANRLVGLGGLSVVAVALTESPRLNDFAASVRLSTSETQHFRRILKLISEGDRAGLAALEFKEAEIESLQPVVEQLVDTGFLKID